MLNEVRKVNIDKPKEAEQENGYHQWNQHLLVVKEGVKETDQKKQQNNNNKNTGNQANEENNGSQPKRNSGRGRAEIAGAALGTGLGVTRIDVTRWTELGVITGATEIAVERLAGCNAMAIVAIAHMVRSASAARHPWAEATRKTRSARVKVNQWL